VKYFESTGRRKDQQKSKIFEGSKVSSEMVKGLGLFVKGSNKNDRYIERPLNISGLEKNFIFSASLMVVE
jgi:hypothetical protein